MLEGDARISRLPRRHVVRCNRQRNLPRMLPRIFVSIERKWRNLPCLMTAYAMLLEDEPDVSDISSRATRMRLREEERQPENLPERAPHTCP